MPTGGRSRRACGRGYAAGLPRPWPDGRAQPPQQERKLGYLRAGARPRGLPLPSPFRERPQSPWEFGAPGSPAKVERRMMKCWKTQLVLKGQDTRTKGLKVPYSIHYLIPTCCPCAAA